MKRGWIVISAVLIGFGSCVYLVGKADKLIFSHKIHSSEACLTCHESIQTSEIAEGAHFPAESVCAGCHDEAFMKKCENCHTNPKRAAKLRGKETALIFSHKAHLPIVENDCVKCHDKIPEANSADESTIPVEEKCMECHLDKREALQCAYCHRRLSTKDLSKVVSFSHKGAWDTHREFARKGIDINTCAQCHEESFCSDCHSKREVLLPGIKMPELVERDFIHRGNYIKRHALEQQVDQTLCYSCHGLSFCNNCHTKKNVSPSSRVGIRPASHTPDWISLHGDEARRNISACASCHSGRDNTCIGCHKPGGVGPSPHPKGWKTNLSRDEEVCRRCHQ